MLSGQVLHKIINDIHRITGADCSVWGRQGKCLAFSGGGCEGMEAYVRDFLNRETEEDMQIDGQGSLFTIREDQERIYVLAIHEPLENAEIIGKLCASQFENLMHAYKEKVDKNRFFQNLLLDNLLLVDILNQAKKLRIDTEKKRVIFLIEPKTDGDNMVLETMKGMYAAGREDFVTSVDEHHIILVKVMGPDEGYKELNDIAKILVDTLNAEAMTSVRVAYGTIADGLKEVSRSYKEAGIALDVGRIFYAEKNILAYSELGIGRLIHQLPASLCEMFLNEVYHGKEMEPFDEETLSTVNKFFENNLNVSETARQLYLHRNTLVYRLEKIQKMTGLDVRVFDDALTFKIALMVANHMKFVQSIE